MHYVIVYYILAYKSWRFYEKHDILLKIFVELYIIEKIKKLGVYNCMDTRQKGLLSQIRHHALVFLISVRDYLKESFNIYIRNYGVIGAAAVLLVIAKIMVFYVLMGTSSHFVSVCVITLLFIYLLFKAFNNKWVPATIFFVLSVLMFCDMYGKLCEKVKRDFCEV